ncbi:MAG: hydrolase, partial [Salinirussus sp.]
MLEWTASPAGEPGASPTPVSLPGRPDVMTGYDAIRYEARLEHPPAPADAIAVLHLNGTYAQSTLEVPGPLLGDRTGPITHDIYYEPLRVPFRPAAGQIAITCEAPSDRFGGFHASDRSPDGDAVPAPWWAADLEIHPLPCIDRLEVRPELTDDGGRLHVRASVLTDGALSDRITFSLRPADEHGGRGTMERAAVEAAGGGREVVNHEITVHDPALWWPRERGEQHQYSLRATLGDSERTVTTGFRSVERNESGLLVNGEEIPIRGVTLRTPNETDIERALDCNATLVRGHAQALPPSVYAACDEAGILVWQDLPLTGPGRFDIERGREFADAIGRVYSQHPALALAAVHDAPTAAFANGLGDGLLDSFRRRWRIWRTSYDQDPAADVAEALPAQLPAVTAIGDPGTGTPARRLFPGWDYGAAEDATSILARDPPWSVGAFGAGALGSGDGTAGDFDHAKHERHVDGDLSDSQAYQADVIGTVAEAVRLEGRGAICDALRD